MLSSFFNRTRSKRRRVHSALSPLASAYHEQTSRSRRRAYGSFNNFSSQDDEEENRSDEDEDSNEDENAHTSESESPLLPIFDATVLDALPVYALTHTMRLLISEKCETVLSWDQLRSPQISQFLLKPIQQDIRTNQFSAATIYALMANCLQFTKEIATNPGNSGTCKTRALVCELLAIKLLKEYDTRGLIDALSYDFDPLQAQIDTPPTGPENARVNWQARRGIVKPARISCLEIAIRAQAKRFLSHPLVVQQLQAIWDGSVVFHNAADSLHRRGAAINQRHFAVNNTSRAPSGSRTLIPDAKLRRMVTLYNPRDASLFKLSRLRVPRYRNLLSTLSFAVLLCLFVAVLTERSLEITSLEVIFWFWTAGYMLDELVTFTEQGFSLYVASFWNTFDLGILLLLIIHFCLRVYGLVTPTLHKLAIANMAYDVLASSAILLFPRLFSVLDHYRYFSQLLIAFKMMAVDLMAVFVLIVIACSGFFVALSLSFGQDSPDDPKSIGFALFQLLLGFTPAAWDRWTLYTPLGRFILTLYMFITHFVVVTILVSVLTNSFMAVVQNANEEHQYLFAVNTISSVKSDSLFSYVPPFNILQWLLTPVSYCLPFRRYIHLNRTIIKITHFPILFTIYLYERTVLRASVVDSIDMIERRTRKRTLTERLPRILREPSMVNFRQDQALEEVFKRPFDETVRTAFLKSHQRSSNVVNKWMNAVQEEDAGPPEEQDPKVLNKLEKRRPIRRNISAYSRGRHVSRYTMSVASDPADLASHADFFSSSPKLAMGVKPTLSQLDDADGDDELLSNDPEEDDRLTTDQRDPSETRLKQHPSANFYLRSAPLARLQRGPGSVTSAATSAQAVPSTEVRLSVAPARRERQIHQRTVSDATMIYNPPTDAAMLLQPSEIEVARLEEKVEPDSSGFAIVGSNQSSDAVGRKLPKKKAPRERPALPLKDDAMFRSTPNLNNLLGSAQPHTSPRRSSLEMDLVSDIGDNKAIGGGYVGAIPASFATQMALATGGMRHLQRERQDEQDRISRMMLARMNSLEEGFRDVIHEMRESLKPQSGTASRRSGSPEKRPKTPVQARKSREQPKVKQKVKPDISRSGVTSTEDNIPVDSAEMVPTSPSIQITVDAPPIAEEDGETGHGSKKAPSSE